MRRLIALTFFFAFVLSPSVANATGVCIGDTSRCGGGGGGGGGGSGATNPFANVQLSISNGDEGQFAQASSPSSGQPGNINNTGVNEGNDCMFTIHRDGPNNKTASVDWKTRDGTALASQSPSPSIQGDYVPGNGTAFFKPEQRDVHIFIQTLQDFHAEPEEYFFVILKNPVKAVIEDPKGKCKIFANSNPD